MDNRLPGVVTVPLSAGARSRRCLARGSDIVLVVLDGRPLLAVGDGPARPCPAGAVVVCPRGVPWSWCGGGEPARVVVIAFPAGPQQALAALAEPGARDEATLLAIAAEQGLELVLGPVGSG